MSYVVLTNTTLTDPADKTEVEANFDDLKTVINGNLNSDNIAELDVDKLTGQFYNHMVAFPAGDLLNGSDTHTILIPHGTWTIVSAHWTSDDIGDSTGTALIEEGSWTSANTWTSTKATSTMTIDTINGTFTANTFTGSTTGNNGIAYRLNVSGGATGAISLFCTVVLKRKIHT